MSRNAWLSSSIKTASKPKCQSEILRRVRVIVRGRNENRYGLECQNNCQKKIGEGRISFNWKTEARAQKVSITRSENAFREEFVENDARLTQENRKWVH